MSIRFGTGGWRAIIGDGFTRRNIRLLCGALAGQLKEDGKDQQGFVIGYDRRFLSREAAYWAAQVLCGQGVRVQLIDEEAPTPLMMFCITRYGLGGGMAVTASHNPAVYNGIKVFLEGGRDADEAYTARLEARADALEATGAPLEEMSAEEARRQGLLAIIDPMNDYIDSILSVIDTEAIRRRGLRVALDPMYGVSKTALQTVLLTVRCHLDVIHDRHDTLFGGRLPAPNAETLNSLRNFVSEHGCDIGLATDGDADRLGVIDDRAQFVHPNKILVLLYYYLLRYKNWRGPAVRNVATTHLLDRVAADFGQTCYEVPVGFKHISGKMAETDAIIGGESSGGLTVKGHIRGKDGIYAASLIIEMIAVTGKSLSAIWSEIEQRYGRFEMSERDLTFTRRQKEEILDKLMVRRELPDFGIPVERVSYQDGCKVYFQNGGWIIARFSGTEPLLRIFCEMDSLRQARSVSDRLEDFLRV